MSDKDSIEAKLDKLLNRIGGLENQVVGLESTVDKLTCENRNLKKECKKYQKEITKLKKSHNEDKKKIRELEKSNKEKDRKIAHLEDRLSVYENPKNSQNSSKAPSSDIARPKRTQSLREKSDRKPGGQPGHKGNTLKMTDTPDHIEQLKPKKCERCGANIMELPSKYIGRRQVLDIPPIKPEYTEYQVFQTKCTCGCHNEASFPEFANTPISYGPSIQGLIAYFSARQYVPVKRMAEMFSELLGVNVSTGGISYIVNKVAKKAIPMYNDIKTNVFNANVIGADETSVNVNGDKHWIWTFQQPLYTFLAVHPKRGKEALDAIAPKSLKHATLVTDCWASYFSLDVKAHQLCIAHLLRELKYFGQRYKYQMWSIKMTHYLGEANRLWNRGIDKAKHQVAKLKKKIDDLLKERINPKHEKMVVFKNRLIKLKEWLLYFLDHPEVPPDNNASERACRNVKVKQKVSGFFKSSKGADSYVVFRSIIDSAIKQGKSPLMVLQNIALSAVTE